MKVPNYQKTTEHIEHSERLSGGEEVVLVEKSRRFFVSFRFVLVFIVGKYTFFLVLFVLEVAISFQHSSSSVLFQEDLYPSETDSSRCVPWVRSNTYVSTVGPFTPWTRVFLNPPQK